MNRIKLFIDEKIEQDIVSMMRKINVSYVFFIKLQRSVHLFQWRDKCEKIVYL